MTHRRECILKTIKSVADYHHKRYCFPPIKRIRELLKRFYDIDVCRRTLYRDMKWLEENEFIGRQCRHFRKRNGELRLRSTLYWLCRNGYRYFESLAQWLKKHVRGFAVTKMSLDKPPKSEYSCFGSLVNGVFGSFKGIKGRASPIGGIL